MTSRCSKDGTCKVWSVGTGAVLCVAEAASAMPPPPPPPRSVKARRNPEAAKFIVRACKFVGDDGLVSVQSASRGAAHAASWALALTDAEGPQALDVKLRTSRRVSKHPVSALCLQEHLVAVGTVEGVVSFFNSRNLLPRASSQVHDLPVTALAFGTAKTLASVPLRVFSASADYKIVATPDARRTLPVFATLAVFAAVLAVFAALLFEHGKSGAVQA